MTIYQPGTYTISATVTMPAQVARKLGAPEKARYSGDTATRTFGPVEIRVPKKSDGGQLAARFVASCLAEHPRTNYTIGNFNIKPA